MEYNGKKVMLTEEQYIILRCLINKTPIDEDKCFDTLIRLSNLGYAVATSRKSYNFMNDRICNFKITEKGKSSCVEYEKSLRQENREIESLQIAKEANERATQANKISIWSITISAILSALTIAASVLIAVFVKG